MKHKFSWWQILGGIFELFAIVFLILCIATNINDDLFLPLALLSTLVANVTMLVMNIRKNRKNK